MSRLRILFVYHLPSPFILADLELLRGHFEVKTFDWRQHAHPARVLTAWMLRHRQEFDLAFFWFGGGHATVGTRVAHFLGKKSVIQVGGFDLSKEPQYGFLSTPQGMRWARMHYRYATRVLAVSQALRRRLVELFPLTEKKSLVLATGVDMDKFHPAGTPSKRILSVAFVDTWQRALIKGWDRIAATARRMPSTRFVLIGSSREVAARLDGPRNLEIRKPTSQDLLISEYQASEVYMQASRSEGLPNAVMEAMACGCVPVVTDVGGMRELVDTAGIVVSEEADLVQALDKAFHQSELRADARARIARHYSMRQREEGLVRILEGIWAEG